MKQENLLNELKNNSFLLAPMAGITDSPFRSFMKEMGCGIITTELVSAQSIKRQNKRSLQLMHFREDQRPIGIQIFGEDLESLSQAAQMVEQSGADFVDINFGCPVTKIIKKGAGSAVLKDLTFLGKILKAVKNSISIPLSIKIRTGWDTHSRNSQKVTQIAFNEGVIWIAIHGRTRTQAYSGKSDWDYITQVKAKSPLPIIGNGDLISTEQIIKLKKQSQCDGMMIGRGCLKNPLIFQQTREKYGQMTIERLKENQNIYFLLKRLRHHLENFYDENMFLLQYKKFCAWYSAGYPQSTVFRKEIFQARERQEVLSLIENYFHPLYLSEKNHTEYESSLMQGHG